jgi:diguanylate cyclase (GGDEF)-like protein/PAS domain S-box-containing protein
MSSAAGHATTNRLSLRQRQALRMRRFSMAGASALVTFLMLAALYGRDLIPARTLYGGGGAMLFGLICFYLAFRRGWNLKARDPSLTGPMMMVAAAIIMWMMYDSATVRATMGAYLCIIILFGVFRYTTRTLLTITGLFLAVYGVMLTVLWAHGHHGTALALDAGRLIVMACVLPLLAWVGGQINALRRRLHERKVFFESIWNTCNDAVVVVDRDGVIRYTNPAIETVFGYDPHLATGMRASMLQDAGVEPAHCLETVSKSPAALERISWETHGVRGDGSRMPVEVTLSRTIMDGSEMTVAFLADITKRKMAEDQIRHLAHHDALTGLPNRALMNDRLEQALAAAGRQGSAVWVLFLDFDRFKLINDSLGHRWGDFVLTTLAARMSECCRASDTAARLGGDEFIMVLTELTDTKLSASIVERLMTRLAEPIELGGQSLQLTASIGIAAYPEDGDSADTLIERADVAMYQAKQNGRNNFCFYTPSMNATAVHRLEMEGCLRTALERGEFRLHYQPQLDIEHGTVHDCEALLRWQDPKKGLVPPAEFIGIAEDTGLIVPIGAWVIRTACEQHCAWLDAGLGAIRVAVNLSPLQFASPELVDTVAGILRDTGMHPDFLELEITESMVMQDVGHAVALLGALKQLGVRLAIDDFGTGYSSLAYLKRFPIDVLKIDRSFILDLTTDEDSEAIVAAVITLAKALRLDVVAEGVEEQEQLDRLRDAKCDRMQGYLLSRPLPAPAFEQFMRDRVEQAAVAVA